MKPIKYSTRYLSVLFCLLLLAGCNSPKKYRVPVSESSFNIKNKAPQKKGFPLSAGVHSSGVIYRNGFLPSEAVYVKLNLLKKLNSESSLELARPTAAEQFVDVYIIEHGSIQSSEGLRDITKVVERVNLETLAQGVLAWPSPKLGKYDVVLDINKDGRFTPNVDVFDGIISPGLYVSPVCVNTISFTGGDLDGLLIYDNIKKDLIIGPEYDQSTGKIKPVLGISKQPLQLDVSFRASPTVTSCEIRASHTLLKTDQVSVNFNNGKGTARFVIAKLPNSVGKILYEWNWSIKNLNGTNSSDTPVDSTGPHILYSTYSTPIAPMEVPWLEVLEIISPWINNAESREQILSRLTSGMYGHFNYHHLSQWYSFNPPGFPVSRLLESNRVKQSIGAKTSMDCAAFAKLYATCCSLLGIDDVELRLIDSQINKQDAFEYKPLLPAPGTGSPSGGTWNYHKVCTYESLVIDASSKLSGTILAKGDLSILDYINLLTDDENIKVFPTDPTDELQVH